MDTSSQTDLRYLNDQNSQPCDAKATQRMDELFDELCSDIRKLKTDLIRWLFVFWLANLVTMLGFMRYFTTGRILP